MTSAVLVACGPGAVGDGGSSESADELGGDTESGGTTETGDGTEASTDGPDEGNFVDDTGCADGCLPDPCNSFDQDCPEGDKCVPTAGPVGSGYDGYACVPVSGDGQPGDPCSSEGASSGIDSCGATSFCWSVDADKQPFEGSCVEFCGGEPYDGTCSEGASCFEEGVLAMCLQTCNPVYEGCELTDEACTWTGQNFNCLPAGDTPTGEVCESIIDCAEGNMCIDAEFLIGCEGPSCCAAFCKVPDGDAPCQATNPDYSCMQFFEGPGAPNPDPDPAYDIGVCIHEPAP